MPRRSPYEIVLSPAEKRELERISRRYTVPYYQVVRAKVVLLAAQGLDNKSIGSELDIPRQIASRWRKRFFDQRLLGLQDRARPGRPSGFPPDIVVRIKAPFHLKRAMADADTYLDAFFDYCSAGEN